MKQYFIYSKIEKNYIHTGNKNKLCFTNFPTTSIKKLYNKEEFEIHLIDLIKLKIVNKFDINKKIINE